MQRGGDERAVTPGIGEPRDVLEPANAAAGQQRHPGRGGAHACNQPQVEARAGADARQIDHDDGAGAGIGGARGQQMHRLARRDGTAHAG